VNHHQTWIRKFRTCSEVSINSTDAGIFLKTPVTVRVLSRDTLAAINK